MGDLASIPGLGRSPGEGKGYPLQNSGLEDSLDCILYSQWGQTRLSNLGFPGSSAGTKSTCSAGDSGLIPGCGRSAGEGIGYPLQYSWASLVAQLVKNPPAMGEIWVQSLGSEDALEKGKGEVHGLYRPLLRCISQSTAGPVECSPLHQWMASHCGHLHFKERTFSKSVNTFDNNHMWCLFLIWWYLTILRVGHDWASSLSLSCIGEGNGNPLQCSCLENPRDGGAWWAAVYGVAQSRTRLKWLSSSNNPKKDLCNTLYLTVDIMWLLTSLIVLFLLFAPRNCDCVTGFVSSYIKAFKLQMVAQTPATVAASSNYYLGPLDQRPSIWGLGEYVALPI